MVISRLILFPLHSAGIATVLLYHAVLSPAGSNPAAAMGDRTMRLLSPGCSAPHPMPGQTPGTLNQPQPVPSSGISFASVSARTGKKFHNPFIHTVSRVEVAIRKASEMSHWRSLDNLPGIGASRFISFKELSGSNFISRNSTVPDFPRFVGAISR